MNKICIVVISYQVIDGATLIARMNFARMTWDQPEHYFLSDRTYLLS